MKKNIIKPSYKEKNPKNQKETEQIFHSNEKKKKTNSNSEEEKVVAFFFFFFFFTAKMNGGPSGFSTFIHLPYSIFHTLLFFSFFIVNFCWFSICVKTQIQMLYYVYLSQQMLLLQGLSSSLQRFSQSSLGSRVVSTLWACLIRYRFDFSFFILMFLYVIKLIVLFLSCFCYLILCFTFVYLTIN